MNIMKTVYITFSANKAGQPATSLSVKIHNKTTDLKTCTSNSCTTCEKLNKVPYARYLGVQFDQRLRWNEHIQSVNKKIRTLIYFFKIIAGFATKKLMKNVYFALAQSLIQYGIIVWGSAAKKHLNTLYVTQKYILKVIAKKPKMYSTDLLFQDLNLLKVESIWKLELLKFAAKNKIICVEQSKYNTRGNEEMMIKIIKSKTDLANKCVKNCCIREYNKLPIELKKLIVQNGSYSYSFIGKKLKKYFLDF